MASRPPHTYAIHAVQVGIIPIPLITASVANTTTHAEHSTAASSTARLPDQPSVRLPTTAWDQAPHIHSFQEPSVRHRHYLVPPAVAHSKRAGSWLVVMMVMPLHWVMGLGGIPADLPRMSLCQIRIQKVQAENRPVAVVQSGPGVSSGTPAP